MDTSTNCIFLDTQEASKHRRRIELEDNAKVVALVWGAESLPRYSCIASVYLEQTVDLSWSIWNKRLNSTV